MSFNSHKLNEIMQLNISGFEILITCSGLCCTIHNIYLECSRIQFRECKSPSTIITSSPHTRTQPDISYVFLCGTLYVLVHHIVIMGQPCLDAHKQRNKKPMRFSTRRFNISTKYDIRIITCGWRIHLTSCTVANYCS